MEGFTGGIGRDPNPKPTRFDKPDDAGDAVGAKGALGPPVNCCTMARKFVVSVLSKVVGVRREARDRRRVGFATRPSGLKCWEDDGGDEPESEFIIIPSGGLVVVVVVVEELGIEGVRP